MPRRFGYQKQVCGSKHTQEGYRGRGPGPSIRRDRPISRIADMAKRSRYGRLVRWLPYIILLAIVVAVLIWIPGSPA